MYPTKFVSSLHHPSFPLIFLALFLGFPHSIRCIKGRVIDLFGFFLIEFLYQHVKEINDVVPSDINEKML